MSWDWQVASHAPPDLSAWAGRGGRLFASSGWAQVLRGLNAEPLFAWAPARGIGTVLPVFRRFGLRIGFLGFPVAGADFDALDGAELERAAGALARAARLDLVRTTQSLCSRVAARAVAARPEAWIEDLSQWQLSAHKRLRKDLAFARRALPALQIEQRDFDPAACYALYAATVTRHGGQLRYEAAYFSALLALAQQSDALRFFAALDGSSLKGFAVVALHAGVAYYLHGAVDADGRRQGVSDVLLERLIAFARDAGAARFTLMASPWEQPGLLKFKQKWADAHGVSLTTDVAGSLLGRGAVLASRWQGRHDAQRAVAFVARRAETAED